MRGRMGANGLFVDDALDRRRGRAVGGFVVTAVVAGHLALSFELLIAVVRGSDALVLRFGFARRERHNGHLVFICHETSLSRSAEASRDELHAEALSATAFALPIPTKTPG